MAKNWIAGAVKHKGRCKHMGSAECPAGSPQYRLAVRFKSGDLSHHARKKKKIKYGAGNYLT